ncbi:MULTISPECIES: transketolase C-terminal domain-containing protein [unclassified Embleya]|uniref:transketolase family protein n=1 Tax=unclassified Embleya TaxID=2699296 RepID=UPI0033FCBFEF
MRDAFGAALLRACEADERLFVLDGDCSHSTRSGRVADRLPGSFLNTGIAEQNMMGMAAGLALAGLRPVVSGFASILVGRAAEQILLSIGWPGLPVTIAGHYAGMSGSLEGAPHHAITDLAFMRSVPGMNVWVPADDADAERLGGEVLAGTGVSGAPPLPGPNYLRLCRNPVPPVAGGPRGPGDLRVWDRPAPEVAFVACGVAVPECVAAAELLGRHGVSARVLGALRIKPFPDAEVYDLVRSCSLVVTVEEHTTIGGLGGAVAELIAARGGPRVLRLGIADTFTETGPYRQLLDRYGIEAEAIAAATRAARLDPDAGGAPSGHTELLTVTNTW